MIAPDLTDIVSGSLYDCLTLQPGESLVPGIRMFVEPAGRAKTFAETNMHDSGKLPPPNFFQIRRIVFTFSVSTKNKDLYAIAEAVTWNLWIGQKRYVEVLLISLPSRYETKAPIRTCSFCRAVFAARLDCPSCGASAFTLPDCNETTGRQFYLDLAEPLYLLTQQSFYGNFSFCPYVVESTLKLWVHLEGLHGRPVQ